MSVETVKSLIHNNKVIVFSKTYCPYCKSAKALLDSLKAQHKVIELDVEANGAELQAALEQLSGQRTVPNIFINEEHIGGNSDIQALHSKGGLIPKLKEASAL
eukprot:TRINITY_DN1075_c0_g1_i1.p1 TRINITY_DN1075_c0_g1~~TRINITY_DN1075_c0_g1_i1.p1  ORF type:complete len:103 (+),score=33.00 TRINITY_DN1075_c0_g1_i1:138-446(+)